MELPELDQQPAEGELLHVAGFDGGSLRILDLWEPREHWERFAQSRMMPAIEETWLEGEPSMRFDEAHDYFRVPGVEFPEPGPARTA